MTQTTRALGKAKALLTALQVHQRRLARGEAVSPKQLDTLTDGLVKSLQGARGGSDPALIEMLGRIQTIASRNARLITAALEGVAAAQRRLAEIEASRTALGTYDLSGRKTLLAGSQVTRDKKF